VGIASNPQLATMTCFVPSVSVNGPKKLEAIATANTASDTDRAAIAGGMPYPPTGSAGWVRMV
jgi:hypothetical protein